MKNVNGFEAPALTVDAACVRPAPNGQGFEVLLVQRGNEPHKGNWAFPGGFVDVGETVEDACLRELREETGCDGTILDILWVYSDPARDPRGHTVSVTFACLADGEAEGASDATDARWFPVDAPPEMAFDHADILKDLRDWLHAGGADLVREAHA